MLAPSETVAPSATSSLYFDPPYDHSPLLKPSQPSFKKHKVLPHPRANRRASTTSSTNSTNARPLSFESSGDDAITVAPRSSNDALSATPPRLTKETESSDTKVIGPDLPPTPPTHSRTSSGSSSIPPSTPTPAVYATTTQEAATAPTTSIPGTPTHQKSPPTPEVTPPHAGRRPKAFIRPVLTDRNPSRVTADSRTESFKTARESPGVSEEEETTTPRALLPSAPLSSQTVARRQLEARSKKGQDLGLGLGLGIEDNLTPRTQQAFFTFDGEWASTSDVEQEWDDNLNRNVMVRKRRGEPKINGRAEVIEDVTVTPTNATKALRSVSLQHERIHIQSSPQSQYLPMEFTSRGKSHWGASTSESSVSTDVKRSSGMSSKSTVSTVVEAILVEVPPQRQKTLRHVRKQIALRDSSSEISPPSSSSPSVRQVERIRQSRPPDSYHGPRTVSMASTGTTHSLASRKGRREVWKNGGIPVVVIPDRKESMKSRSSGPPSLRSMSSNHSKRSVSLGSAQRLNHSRATEISSHRPQQTQRGRSMSESHGTHGVIATDQLTMDYPPIVPRRTSSLSAPTSRNTSRAGSLTTESLEAHNTLMELDLKKLDVKMKKQPPQVLVERASAVEDTGHGSNQRQLRPATSIESHKNDISNQRSLVDHNGDPFFGKRLTVHNTPFSQASVDTNGTHSVADIAEAMAVNIYPHQNKSVLMVHHMSKPVANDIQEESNSQVDSSEATNRISTNRISTNRISTNRISGNPEITAIGPDGGPVTPPQPQFYMDEVDSPLRNPRAPPEPPAIQFIPATPSGLTPNAEKDKMLGNYFGEIQKRPSLVRRAFSLRKNSENGGSRASGFLARTLSLSKTMRRDTAETPNLEKARKDLSPQYPSADDPPPDEDKLHPFWRPANEVDLDSEDDCVYDVSEDHGERDHHYHPEEDRPKPVRRRSLSERMRRTFAILPIEDDDHYVSTDRRSPERRTIKRTPSGSLRVMPHRDSFSSSTLRWSSGFSSHDSTDDRPSTAPEDNNRCLFGVEKRVDDRGRRIFPGWQEKLGQYRPQNLQRRLSEHRRQKRTEALRQKISGPREIRDPVGEVIKRNSYKGPSYQTGSHVLAASHDRQS
ncbi:hypothetical protein F5Y18DRAFT_16220 [Xylariaceae sp. FL1019]|nr:hypothetical protein F5Y18DRAFT_16220 [Xylariaceae sp. FL1019]